MSIIKPTSFCSTLACKILLPNSMDSLAMSLLLSSVIFLDLGPCGSQKTTPVKVKVIL